jgi:hypothetical protein
MPLPAEAVDKLKDVAALKFAVLHLSKLEDKLRDVESELYHRVQMASLGETTELHLKTIELWLTAQQQLRITREKFRTV